MVLTKPSTANSLARRRRIQQLVRNAFPGCVAEFVKCPNGYLAFRVRVIKGGAYRSAVIKFYSHYGNVMLNKHWLERAVQWNPVVHTSKFNSSETPLPDLL